MWSMRRMAYLSCRNLGSAETRRYGNGQEYTERDLGVLCVCVCAAEATIGRFMVKGSKFMIYGIISIRSLFVYKRGEIS